MPSFTPDSELELLFSPTLIPEELKAQLGSDLHVCPHVHCGSMEGTLQAHYPHTGIQIRPLARTDINRSHLTVLSVLTSTPNLSESQYAQAFDTLRSCPNTYFTLVIVSRDTDQIVGVGSVFLEQKFTRNLGRVGHIEDIAVDKKVQGRKLGLRIIQALTGISEKVGCYKTILNCSDSNVPFYQKCGYEKKENEMAKYHTVAERPVHTPRL